MRSGDFKDISLFIEEDIGYGDITTESLSIDKNATGEIKVNENCVVAGLIEAVSVFSRFEVTMTPLVNDGDRVEPGTIIATVAGPGANILTSERLALNILMHMCGIATKTRNVIDKISHINPNVRVAATRKTVPGFRRFQKRAVAIGGGDTHRIRLDDMFLIKDNHIAMVGTIKETIERAKGKHFSKKIEVEAENLQQALTAVDAGADIILLDNFSPEDASEAYEKIKSLDSRVLVELSGGMDENNIADYASSADIISLGALTHSYKSTDLSLSINPE